MNDRFNVAMACVILPPPVKSMIFTSIPCFLKKPILSPTSTAMIESAVAAALPTTSVVSANACGAIVVELNAIAR